MKSRFLAAWRWMVLLTPFRSEEASMPARPLAGFFLARICPTRRACRSHMHFLVGHAVCSLLRLLSLQSSGEQANSKESLWSKSWPEQQAQHRSPSCCCAIDGADAEPSTACICNYLATAIAALMRTATQFPLCLSVLTSWADMVMPVAKRGFRLAMASPSTK